MIKIIFWGYLYYYFYGLASYFEIDEIAKVINEVDRDTKYQGLKYIAS